MVPILVPTQLTIPNGISIESAVFSQYRLVTDGQTDRRTGRLYAILHVCAMRHKNVSNIQNNWKLRAVVSTCSPAPSAAQHTSRINPKFHAREQFPRNVLVTSYTRMLATFPVQLAICTANKFVPILFAHLSVCRGVFFSNSTSNTRTTC